MNTSKTPITAFILAAGKSRRFGQPKVLQSFAGIPFLTRIRQNLMQIGIDRPFLILGYQARELIPLVPEKDSFEIIINPRFESGMFTSVQSALRALPDSVFGTLLCLIDQPHILPQTYHRLMQSAIKNPHNIIIPTFNQRGGHPIYLPASLFEIILRANPQSTLKDILTAHRSLILRIETDDPGIREDIDTPEDLVRLEKIFAFNKAQK